MALKVKFRTAFPASVVGGTGIAVTKSGLTYTFDLDWSDFSILSSYNPSSQQALVQNTTDGSFGLVTITQIIAGSQTQQIKTGAGDVNVATTDGLIIVNKTVGGATTVNLPASSSKVGAVKIVDFKGDTGTNNITIAVVGSDKLNGNRTTWIIASDGGSVVCTPLSDGSGYAI